MKSGKCAIFWFRRDLRLFDNRALSVALQRYDCVIPIFIFDKSILSKLDAIDRRVSFICDLIVDLERQMGEYSSKLTIFYGNPLDVFKEICSKIEIDAIFYNKDYEPSTILRDSQISSYIISNNIIVESYKDHLIFEEREIVKADGTPYSVYTPYSKRWLELFKGDESEYLKEYTSHKFLNRLANRSFLDRILSNIEPSLVLSISGKIERQMGFEPVNIDYSTIPKVKSGEPVLDLDLLSRYDTLRDFPAKNGCTNIGIHLRFGSVSIRKCVKIALKTNFIWLKEFIWREFFSCVLYNYPYVELKPFKDRYQFIEWDNNYDLLEKWCSGTTGIPFVDAGMRELNTTGHMHNRVRMVCASFLTKNLLIDWRVGESYFASKLFDFDLASNNGNWQWAAGCGCDAAPYFRVFNPYLQAKKFDNNMLYIKRWIPEIDDYGKSILPCVDIDASRKEAIIRYKTALS